MKYNEFINHINANTLQGAFLLHGEDEFFKARAVKAVQEMLPPEISVFNLSVIEEASLDDIASRCEVLPVMSDKTVVIARGLAQNTDSGALCDYIVSMPMSTVLVIVIKGKLEANNKLYKLLSQSGREVLFGAPQQSDAVKWCMLEANKNGVVLDEATARTFIGLVGVDMSFVSNELKKLIDLAGDGGKIDNQLVSRSAISTIEAGVFDAIACFTSKKQADGMRALHALLAEEKDIPMIVAALLSNFKLMLEARALFDKGYTAKNAMQKMSGKPYPNEKACNAAKKYSFESIARLVGELTMAISNQRSGGASAKAAIESAMLSFDW